MAAFATNPDNATAWYDNIRAVGRQSPRPLVVTTRLEFVAQVLGRRLTYTYEVADLVPGERFVMRTAQGPFPNGDDLHLERCRRRRHADDAGQPWRADRLCKAVRADGRGPMRRANRKDLERLKALLEQATSV